MGIGYWRAVLSSFTSDLSWFSSFLYQCVLIPLALSVIVLSETKHDAHSIMHRALTILAACAACTVIHCLLTPFFPSVMSLGVANHILLLVCVIVYALFFSTLLPSARIVVAAAMFTGINWAFSITHLILFPLMPLLPANLTQMFLLLLGFAVIRVFRPAPTERMPVIYWLTMLLIAIISYVCLFVVRIMESMQYNGGVHTAALQVMLPSFFVVSLLIYYLYYVLTKEYRKSAQIAALQMKQARDIDFYNRSEALCTELHSLRHELKNHYAAMDALLKEKNYEKLEQYFAAVMGQSTGALTEFHCDNVVVSSILDHSISSAAAAGIKLDAVAAIPNTLPIEDADLCSLLSNLLDNGVEACLRTGDNAVRASLHTEKGFLFISVSNPVHSDVLNTNPMLHTTKKDAAGHGFGIPIIRRIAEKYNGCATFSTQNGWFTADVMLAMEDA